MHDVVADWKAWSAPKEDERRRVSQLELWRPEIGRAGRGAGWAGQERGEETDRGRGGRWRRCTTTSRGSGQSK